ncbi:hypothetical protein LNL84_05810 [Vibrio sp. ZSDZ34]|uniref:Uncharacterized protein n=1 Tax=Vibrio gelatinilyticus TaxID=2893468 RepID=A0A9X2AY63_9VIBR|nr:hypothetical protein [Vibrio gelatinilyticus]MCJ2376348.1 hypothetical protein [Vibrio gelatinilyticus]
MVPLSIPSLCGPNTIALIIRLSAELATHRDELHMPSVYSGVIAGFAHLYGRAVLYSRN